MADNDPKLMNQATLELVTQGDTGSASRVRVNLKQLGNPRTDRFSVRVKVCNEGVVADSTNATIAAVAGSSVLATAHTATKDITLFEALLNETATGILTLTGVAIEGETITLGTTSYKFGAGGLSAADLVGFTEIDISATAAAAEGTLTVLTLPTALDAMNVAGKVYTFVANGSANSDGEIAVGVAAVAQIEVFTAVADVTDSLDGLFLQLSDEDGTVGVWFDTDNSGTTIPAGAAALDRAIEVTGIVTDDTAADVATAVASAIDGDSKFSAAAVGAIVTVTHATGADVGDGEAGTSTFTTFSVSTDGVSPTAIDNIIAAINGTDSVNTANASVTAADDGAGTDTLTVTAKSGGVAGNSLVFTESFTAAGNVMNGSGTIGTTTAGDDTTASEAVTAIAATLTGNATGADGAGDTVDVTASASGTTGNIASTETMANGSFATATLTGGTDESDGAIEFDLTDASAETVTVRIGMGSVGGVAANYTETLDVTHAAP